MASGIAQIFNRRNSAYQWITIILVGTALGVYIVGISFLPSPAPVLLIIPVLVLPILLMIGNFRKLLLSIVALEIWFPLDAHLGYREDIGRMAGLGGLNLSMTTIALAVLYGWWFAELLTRRDDNRLRPALYMSLPLIFLLVFSILSLVVARDTQLVFFQIWLQFQMLLLFVYIVGTVRTREEVMFIFTMLVIGLLLHSLLMIGTHFLGHSVKFGPFYTRIDNGLRVGGTAGSPNSTGGTLGLMLTPIFSLLLTKQQYRFKQLAALAFGLGCIGLILTFSRGGWLAFGISIIVFCLLAALRGWLPLKLIISLVLIVGLSFLLLQDAILSRVQADDHGAAYSRVPLMELALHMIEDSPIFGIGANNFGYVARIYASSLGGIWLSTVHNKYLLIWSEIGTGGLIAFLAFLVLTLRRAWATWSFQDMLFSPLALGFFAGLTGHMVHLFAEILNDRPQIQCLWLVAALVAAMSMILREEKAYATRQ
jgi:putative inorganic carbon (HCO3(-)) transporter